MLNEKREGAIDLGANKKGFSLIKSIVVVTIMVVLVTVLGPSLLAHIEKARVKKDNSAMDEVVNAIQLALMDQDVYDEVLFYSTYNNVSCYINNASEVDSGYVKTTTKTEVDLGGKGKNGPQYIYGDEARLADETPYYAAGNMCGVTITFEPESGNTTRRSVYDLRNGKINKFNDTTGTARTVTMTYVGATPAADTMTLGKMKAADSTEKYLYNHICATVGDKIKLTSQAYRNSEYTIFIRIGTIGDADTNHQDAIKVYGQWNGTNLGAQTED